MSKYDQISNYYYEHNASDSIVTEDETVLFRCKPHRWAFALNKSVKMMPFALIWLAFDSSFLLTLFKVPGKGALSGMALFLIPFFALHLMPVWIWLGNVISASKKWRNAEYIVTDKRIITQNGFVGREYSTAFYKEITDVQLRIQVLDRIFGVGDIYISTGKGDLIFYDVPNPHEIYQKLQRIILDIQTDIQFPNAMRPGNNPGYHTEYTGMQE
ncbi:MAG: PH domain-containing protein [Lachnospiraceae bacterium]|nr:PH domain-containing protein [Lachnospiraceae bacterium]